MTSQHKFSLFFLTRKLGWAAIGLLMMAGLTRCSSESKTVTAKSYHNFHAFFNGYYHANVRYKEATQSLEKAVLPPDQGYMSLIDPLTDKPSEANMKLLDEAIKKCEVVIYRRKNSDWVDDSRFLIGRCWYYKRNFAMAQMNFDYLRFAHKKSDLIPNVMLWQAKTQYQYENYWNTKQILNDLLKLPRVDNDVRGESSLILADLLVKDGEYSRAIQVLDDDLPNIQGKRNLARVHFLLGQLYDKLSVFSKSLDHYQKAQNLNYSDAFSFKATLAILNLKIKYQPENDVNSELAREFGKLASESRYEEFFDEIYYQRALLSLKENATADAMDFLKKSIAVSKGNNLQKTLSYFKVGELYFSKLHKLNTAQAYFDSAAKLAQPTMAEFKRIQNMSKVLDQYVDNKNTVQEGDSLLYLSKLTENEQNEVLDRAIDDEALRAENEAQKKAAGGQVKPSGLVQLTDNNGGANTTSGPNASSFYFDNTALVATGKTEFVRIFGNRINEDNWRRSKKEVSYNSNANAIAITATPAVTEKSRKEIRDAQREALRKEIPKDTAAIGKINRKSAEALGALASLFNDELAMPDSAERTYQEILQRYPKTNYAARSLYALYRLYLTKGPETAQAYSKLILTDYPTSQFAQLIRNENKKTKLESGDSETAYEGVYALYKNGDYNTVLTFANILQPKFNKDDPFSPKLMYLKGLAYAQLQNIDSMISTYKTLVAVYPNAPIAKWAQATLKSYTNREYLTSLPHYEFSNTAATDKKDKTSLVELEKAATQFRDFSLLKQPQENLMTTMLIETSKIGQKELITLLEAFNKQSFANFNLSVNVFQYQNKHMVYIAQFIDYPNAFKYIEALQRTPTIAALVADPKHDIVFATPVNFRIAFAQRRYDNYLEFFKAMAPSWRNEK